MILKQPPSNQDKYHLKALTIMKTASSSLTESSISILTQPNMKMKNNYSSLTQLTHSLIPEKTNLRKLRPKKNIKIYFLRGPIAKSFLNLKAMN